MCWKVKTTLSGAVKYKLQYALNASGKSWIMPWQSNLFTTDHKSLNENIAAQGERGHIIVKEDVHYYTITKAQLEREI